MKLHAFHAGDGDCLLLSSSDDGGAERHMLVDGGRATEFKENAREFVYALPQLDVVCLSHIDEDHIAGVLRLLEDEVAWRVFDFARRTFEAGDGPEPDEPDFPRPPSIGEIWHNALFELVGEELEVAALSALQTTASLLAGSVDEAVRDLASRMDNLATGERSALELSRRISGHQLDVPRNRPRDAVMVRSGADDPGDGNAAEGNATEGCAARGGIDDPIRLGSLELRILGPSADDVEKLRTRWAKWIDNNAEALEKLRRELRGDEERIGSLAAPRVANPMLQASLGEGLSGVSAPNLASLMLLATEGDRTVLLTGDGVSSEILEGLAHHGILDGAGRVHVDVLKVQHHGALANVTREFVDRVSADHYLFCGNGAHHNPELEAVEKMALARLTGLDGGPAVAPGRPFKLWFTSSPRSDLSEARTEHMEKVEKLLNDLRRDHDPAGDVFSFEMIDGGKLTLEL